MKFETKPYEEKMKKAVSVYEENLSTIRAGRANPNALSKITVDYYGTATPSRVWPPSACPMHVR